jgi:hypothetical protein
LAPQGYVPYSGDAAEAQDFGQRDEVAYQAPPPLPVYDQPPIPGDGYIWTPGYWGWNAGVRDYYWIPGTWVLPPRPGLFWTPGFWQWRGGDFAFRRGYWGPSVGFYGGVNYGFGYDGDGYDGDGYEGGRWQGDRFYYNRRVNNLSDRRIQTVYEQNVINNNNYVSYNDGPGGVRARPNPSQIAARNGPRFNATSAQVQNRRAALGRPDLRASLTQGRPAIAATARPGVFNGPDVVTNTRASAVYRLRTPPFNRPQPPDPRLNAPIRPAFDSANHAPAWANFGDRRGLGNQTFQSPREGNRAAPNSPPQRQFQSPTIMNRPLPNQTPPGPRFASPGLAPAQGQAPRFAPQPRFAPPAQMRAPEARASSPAPRPNTRPAAPSETRRQAPAGGPTPNQP